MLIILSGLPGSGKSAVADRLGRALRCPVLSVDPIESAMLRAGIEPTQPTGLAAYGVAQTIADVNLALGLTLVIDAVNAVEEARAAWRDLAARYDVEMRAIECVCSDDQVHRSRLEGRRRGLVGMAEVTWDDVRTRRPEWQPWRQARLVLDSVDPIERNLALALDYVRE